MRTPGLLDGITHIAMIKDEQDCSWDEATRYYNLSMDVAAEARAARAAREAEEAEPTNVVPFPSDRVRR